MLTGRHPGTGDPVEVTGVFGNQSTALPCRGPQKLLVSSSGQYGVVRGRQDIMASARSLAAATGEWWVSRRSFNR